MHFVVLTLHNYLCWTVCLALNYLIGFKLLTFFVESKLPWFLTPFWLYLIFRYLLCAILGTVWFPTLNVAFICHVSCAYSRICQSRLIANVGTYRTSFSTVLFIWYCHLSLGTACIVPCKLQDTGYCALSLISLYTGHAKHVSFCLII